MFLKKYDLEHCFDSYVSSAMFPTKVQWKEIIRASVKFVEEINLYTTFEDPKLRRYSQVYGLSLHVHPIWDLEKMTTGNRIFLSDFAKLNGVLNGSQGNIVCVYCNKEFSDYLNHYIHECTKYKHSREYF